MGKPSRYAAIEIHPLAPAKPGLGEPCNGCGVCCAAEPCPVAWHFLLQRRGRCGALTWQTAANRYVCGMVVTPRRHLRWLPRLLAPALARFCARRIAAGTGCDADMEIVEPVR